MQDFDDIKAVLNQGLGITYTDEMEKAGMMAALEKVLPKYLKNKKGWSADKWKKDLGLK